MNRPHTTGCVVSVLEMPIHRYDLCCQPGTIVVRPSIREPWRNVNFVVSVCKTPRLFDWDDPYPSRSDVYSGANGTFRNHESLWSILHTSISDIVSLQKCHRKIQFIRHYCTKTFSLKDGKYSAIATLSPRQIYTQNGSDLPQKLGIGQLKSMTQTHESIIVELTEPKETLRRDKRCPFLASYTYISNFQCSI